MASLPQDREFFRGSATDILVPENGNKSLEELIEGDYDEQSSPRDTASPFLRIKKRKLLFFGICASPTLCPKILVLIER